MPEEEISLKHFVEINVFFIEELPKILDHEHVALSLIFSDFFFSTN